MILAVSGLTYIRVSISLLSGSFQWVWDFVGKHILGQVLQDLLGCDAFGCRGPDCQELQCLGPVLQSTWGLRLQCPPGFLICLVNSSSALETIRCVWLLPKPALRTSDLLFQPLKGFSLSLLFPGLRCSFMASVIEFGPSCFSLPRPVCAY